MPSEQCAYSIGVYPDATAAAKAHIQIQARGAYEPPRSPAYSLEEWQQLIAEARSEAAPQTKAHANVATNTGDVPLANAIITAQKPKIHSRHENHRSDRAQRQRRVC